MLGMQNRREIKVVGTVLKDRKIVTFYTNNLADKPRKEIERTNEHTLRCVHGKVPVK